MKRASIILIGVGLLALPQISSGQDFLNKTPGQWQNDLGSAEKKVRRNAAFALGKLGRASESAVNTLVQKLHADDPMVQDAVAYALGNIAKESAAVRGNSNVLSALKVALKSPDSHVKRSAAYALGCLGKQAESALSDLTAAMSDGNPAVKQNVAWALGQTRSKDAVTALQAALRDNDPLVRRDAAGAVENLAPEAIRKAMPELVQCCTMPGIRPEILAEVRKPALRAMNQVIDKKDAAAVQMLQGFLNRDKGGQEKLDPEVKLSVAIVLAKSGAPGAKQAIDILREEFLAADKAGDKVTRNQVMVGLANIGSSTPEVLPDMVRGLNHSAQEIRLLATEGLGNMGEMGEDAIPILVQCVANRKETPEVRKSAAKSLSEIGTAFAGLNKLDKSTAALKAVETLAMVLNDTTDNAEVRERVIWALRPHNIKLRDMPNVMGAFEKILDENRKPGVKMLYYDSAYMLGQLKGPEASKKTLDVLLDFLKDPTILIYAGREIKGEKITGEAKSPADRKVLETGMGDGRKLAVEALQRIGAPVGIRDDVVAQLRVIANDTNLWTTLREKSKDLLKSLGK